VPAGPDWLHEIKHDGYRLIVDRDGERPGSAAGSRGWAERTDRGSARGLSNPSPPICGMTIGLFKSSAKL
jgi:hypothetical protein